MFILPLCCLCIFEDSSKPEERRKDMCHPSAPAALGSTCPVVFCSTMQMWPFAAHQMTYDHDWSWDHKAAMKHMDITVSDFCQVSQGGWGCLACWELDQTDVPLLQGEPRQALQTMPFGTEGPDCSGHNPLLAIALRCQLILHKDLEVKGEPSPQWKLPY